MFTKKLISLTLVFVMVVSLVTTAGATNLSTAPITDIQITSGYAFAVNALQEYYSAAYENEAAQINSYIEDASLASLIGYKIELEQYKLRVHPKTNFSVNFTLLDSQLFDGDLYLQIGVDASYFYPNSTAPALFGEVVNLRLNKQNGNYAIAEWLDSSYFDQNVRGTTVDQVTSSAKSALNSAPSVASALSTAATYVQAVKNSLDAELASKGSAVDWSDPIELQTNGQNSTRALSTLNFYNARNYAINNASKTNPDPGSSKVSRYFDYSSWSGNWDCTNFVSHCVMAGGADMRNTGNQDTGWYFVDEDASNGSSRSWRSVNYFYNYFASNTTQSGPIATVYSGYPTSRTGFNSANLYVIQIKYAGSTSFTHSTFMSYFTIQNTTSYMPRISSRTADYSYNIDQNLTDAYPGASYRTVQITASYS